MKSFFLPIGQSAGASLPTILSALSCGAALPVSGLDILQITDGETDPVIPSLIRDLNRMHDLLARPENSSLFPSSFVFSAVRPVLPSLQALSADPASAALLDALRGKGIPLSYKTDREAVEWAFTVLLSGENTEQLLPFRDWLRRISHGIQSHEQVRISILCDLSDPFSVGVAFAVLRYLKNTVKTDPSSVALFSLVSRTGTEPDSPFSCLSGVLSALADQNLIARPDRSVSACGGAFWLLSLPSAMWRSEESGRILYVALSRQIARFCSSEKAVAPGLHTVTLPGILTLQSLGSQAGPFAAFLHASSWLLSDLIPAVHLYSDHSAPLRSLSRNTRNGLFRRLFQNTAASPENAENLQALRRSLSALLSEVLMLIRSLPDQFRLAEASDPVWQQLVDACGRTVTVASEYMVSLAEAEEGGILNVKPVHRVSLADTEEEKAERRLEDIAAQLKQEEETRNRLFASAGGYWTVPALRNCRERCESALRHAVDSRSEQNKTEAHESDRLAAAALSRRIRLLEAAVNRCDRDLSDRELVETGTHPASSFSGLLSPWSGQILEASAAEKLFALISAVNVPAESLRRDVLAALPSFLFGFTLEDVKALFKRLAACCKPVRDVAPLASLVLSVLEVSRTQTDPLRFLSAGNVPAVPLLPDLYPAGPVLTVHSLISLLPPSTEKNSDPVSEKRGIFALLLLRQYRRRGSDEASLSLSRYSAGDSPVLQAWLSAQQSDDVWILSLSRETESLPFALALPGADLIPARITELHAHLVPSFADPWFDRESCSFRDPTDLLGESDRSILLDRIAHITEKPESVSGAFVSFLNDFRKDLVRSQNHSMLPNRLDLRLKAAFGLRLLPAFRPVLIRMPCYYEHALPSDSFAACLTGFSSFPPFSDHVPDDILYLYRNVPFARESSHTLLGAVPIPAENWIMNLLEQECKTLSRTSDDYHDTLMRELNLLLERYPDALPEARRTALDLLEKASEPVEEAETQLVWPWDPKSPSVQTILSESLGNELSSAAMQPFSDLLTVFPARGRDVIGDSLMATMCLLPSAPSSPEPEESAAITPDAVLPPLSADFCAALCRIPEGRTLVRQGLLSFERREQNSVRVILRLEGSFTVSMIRDYSEEEIVLLYAHDIPTLAVWPNLPFASDDWHAYFVYAGLPASVGFTAHYADGTSASSEDGQTRAVCRSASFPLSFSFSRENRSIGSLPNLLPSPVIEKTDPFTACIDFGSVGTSVVFSVGHRRLPLQGPTLVRALLNNPASSRDLLRKEFLPAVPVSALLPTAARIFRNVPGASPLPFEDGIVLMSSDLQDVLSIPSGALYTCLKWEEEKGRSVTLCLHQIMLMAALQARSDGASSLAWCFSIPDEMAKAGRERLAELFSSLAGQVSGESGVGTPEKQPLVTFAPESSALGAYFRFCAPEDTRGGFMVLDIGACTADISLFLRGREQAIRTCQIPLGVHYMLLPSLLRNPGLLQQDLGYIQDPAIRHDLLLLDQIIRNAKADSSALRHSRLALDNFIADRYAVLLPELLQNPVTGAPSKLGSVLLLHFSFLMMLSGLILLQIAADPGKNDFLPEQMSLCLSGRGSFLPEYLPDSYKTALWHFLTMFRNRRVASLSMLFSSEKKMEIPVGLSCLQSVSADLPPASAVPAAISVRPEELLPQFLIRFAGEFPASAEVLFHGFFTGDFYHPFTPYGESLVSEAITQSFTDQTALLPYDALSAWIGALLELIDDSAQ